MYRWKKGKWQKKLFGKENSNKEKFQFSNTHVFNLFVMEKKERKNVASPPTISSGMNECMKEFVFLSFSFSHFAFPPWVYYYHIKIVIWWDCESMEWIYESSIEVLWIQLFNLFLNVFN